MKKFITLLLVLTGMVCTASADTYTVYFRPNSSWASYNANFGLYMYNSETENAFQPFTAVGTTGAYSASFDTSYANIIIVRLAAGATTLGDSWSNKWAQSGNLEAPTQDLAYYDISDGTMGDNNTNWDGWTLSTDNVALRNLSQTWYIAGGRHIVNGFYEWASDETAIAANKMTPAGSIEQTLTVSNRPIKAGTYEYKFVGDNWVGTNAYSNSDYNYELTIASDGVYDITYTFNQLSRTGSVSAVKDDSDESTITYKYYVFDENSSLTGQGWWLNEMTTSADNTVSYTAYNVNLTPGTTYRYKVAEQILKDDEVVNTYWPWNSADGTNGWWTLTTDKTRAYNVTFNFYQNANFKMTSSNPWTSTNAVTTGYYIMYNNGNGWYVGNIMTEADGVYTGTISNLNNGQYFAILPAGNLPDSETTVSNWTGVLRPDTQSNLSVEWSNLNSGSTTTTDNRQVWTNGMDNEAILEITYNSNNTTWSVAPYIVKDFTGAPSEEGSYLTTFSNTNYAVAIPDGVTAYYADKANSGSGVVKMVAFENGIAASTGAFLKAAEAKKYHFTPATSTDDVASNNLFVAGDGVPSVSSAYRYVFAKQDNDLGFYKMGSGFAVDMTGKAYLESATSLATTGARVAIVFDDDVTGINTVSRENVNNNEYYNLAGQRVAQPAKGLYIVNGKKVIMK